MATCPNCKKRIRMNGNRVKKNGVMIHKKCPKDVKKK